MGKAGPVSPLRRLQWLVVLVVAIVLGVAATLLCLQGHKSGNSIRFTHAPDISYREIKGEVIIMHKDGSAVHSLDEVGSFIWKKCTTAKTKGELLDAILADYDVGRAEAEKDLGEFLTDLQERGLVIAVKSR